MKIPSLTECQKAVLWLMYFWQYRGFCQISMPALGIFPRLTEDERCGYDAEGRPIGRLGFGNDVLLTREGLMRTTWLWRYSTLATRLSSVDSALIEVPLRPRYSNDEILSALEGLTRSDRFLEGRRGSADATKVRSAVIAPNRTISTGIPLADEYFNRHHSAVPGIAYWMSDEKSTLKQVAGSHFEPWSIFGGATHRGSQDDFLRIGHMAFLASQTQPDEPPPFDVSIPSGGILVPLRQYLIRCGMCDAEQCRKVLFLGTDTCIKCHSPLDLCLGGRGAAKGNPNDRRDISFVGREAFALTDSGYQAAREVASTSAFLSLISVSPEAIHAEFPQLGVFRDTLNALSTQEVWSPRALPDSAPATILQEFDARGWIEFEALKSGTWVWPSRDSGIAGPLPRMIEEESLLRLSRTGREALAEFQLLSKLNENRTSETLLSHQPAWKRLTITNDEVTLDGKNYPRLPPKAIRLLTRLKGAKGATVKASQVCDRPERALSLLPDPLKAIIDKPGRGVTVQPSARFFEISSF